MKLKISVLLVILFAGINVRTHAQEIQNDFEKHNNWYISFGAGASNLIQFPTDIYFAGSSNLQLGFMYERAFHKRFSLVAGVELEQASYNFDGDIQFNEEASIRLIPAGTDKKYTGIRQRNIAIPIQGRFYFLDNNDPDGRNVFLQSGVRLVQTLDFIDSENSGTTYYFRSQGENSDISLGDFANQTLFQMELMVGFKGQFFENFDLLNASTLGFMYQFTPMLDEESTELYPLHFTWRFLF